MTIANDDDLLIPAFLRREPGPKMTKERLDAIMGTGVGRTWAPIRGPEEKRPAPPRVIFVDDRALPVRVLRQVKEGAPKPLIEHAHMEEFEAWLAGDGKGASVVKTGTIDGTTVVLVRVPPWMDPDRKAPPAKPAAAQDGSTLPRARAPDVGYIANSRVGQALRERGFKPGEDSGVLVFAKDERTVVIRAPGEGKKSSSAWQLLVGDSMGAEGEGPAKLIEALEKP